MGNQVNIYVTAGTIISALGFSTRENRQHIREYRSGIRLINDKNIYESPFMGGSIDEARLQEQVTVYQLDNYSRIEQLFILSIQEVIRRSGIDAAAPDCALILSTTKGDIHKPLPDLGLRIAGHFQSETPPIILSTACISGVSALIVASRLIREGAYKHAIVAGGDLLTRFVVTGFQSFQSVSPEICRPYDEKRDGLSLGEACGSVLVTSGRQFVHERRPVVIEGGAVTNDANHISGPSRTGDGLCRAVVRAMSENKLETADISFINAHGTATVYNDEMESKAIHAAGLGKIPLNSLKPYWGHTLGASGIIESIACMDELRSGELIGTYGFEKPGVTDPLEIHAQHLQLDMKRCIKTASGFGGCNAAVVFALEECTQPVIRRAGIRTSVRHTCTVESGKVTKDGTTVFETDSGEEFASFIRAACKNLGEENRKFYKMDDLCKLGYVAALYLLSGTDPLAPYTPEETGIILANASASSDTDRKHQQIIDTLGDKEASPAVFVYTLPNIVLGEICIRHKIKGENTFFISRPYDETFLRRYAETVMRHHCLRACIIGWCERSHQSYSARFRLIHHS